MEVDAVVNKVAAGNEDIAVRQRISGRDRAIVKHLLGKTAGVCGDRRGFEREESYTAVLLGSEVKSLAIGAPEHRGRAAVPGTFLIRSRKSVDGRVGLRNICENEQLELVRLVLNALPSEESELFSIR